MEGGKVSKIALHVSIRFHSAWIAYHIITAYIRFGMEGQFEWSCKRQLDTYDIGKQTMLNVNRALYAIINI